VGLNKTGQSLAGAKLKLVNLERTHILRTLERAQWRIEGSHGTALLLGFKPSTLRSRMKKLGIRRLFV